MSQPNNHIELNQDKSQNISGNSPVNANNNQKHKHLTLFKEKLKTKKAHIRERLENYFPCMMK